MFNRQAAFNTAYLATIAQGKPSVGARGFCLYRGPDGLKCAIGHLIPDEKYHNLLESNSAGSCVIRDAVSAPQEERSFLAELQACHDSAASVHASDEEFVRAFQEYCEKFAGTYNLTVPEVIG